MIDNVISAIEARELERESISFDRLRRDFAIDGLHDRLGRGRSILASPAELDSYLFSYGPMTRRQWKAVLPEIVLPEGRLQLIDYGCGQGLASALLFDHFGLSLVDRLDQIVLVEPSDVALRRAMAIVACYRGHNDGIVCVNRLLADLNNDDLRGVVGRPVVHLFSNVLDIDAFDIHMLAGKMFRTRGHHLVLAVSHDRDHHGGSARIIEIARAIGNEQNWEGDVGLYSRCSWFRLDDGKPMIFWSVDVEVRHDST